MKAWGISEWYGVLAIGQIVLNLLGFIGVFYLRSAYATRKEHQALANRVTSCEQRHASAVTREDLTAIASQVNVVSGQQGVFQAELRAANRRLDEALPRIEGGLERIEDFLLKTSKLVTSR